MPTPQLPCGSTLTGAPVSLRALRVLLLLAASGVSACVEQSVPIGGIPASDGSDATEPPPPGQIVFGGYGLNSLRFIWAKVEDTSFYRMLKRTAAGGTYESVSGEIDGAGRGPFAYTDTFSVHLTDWINTSYKFQACNVQGCTDSDDTLDLQPSDSVHIIGYMKPFVPEAETQFGYAVAYSADGATLAVTTCTAGVQVVTGHTGSVYVFSRDGTQWTQQARLTGSREIAGTDYGFGCALALSGDGDVLAVGAINDSSPMTGVNPARTDAGAAQSGAVYVFRRTGAAWAEEAYIKASNTGASDGFGGALALSGDGATLAVGAIREDSDALGVHQPAPAQDNNLATDSGAVYVFVHDGEDGWSQQAYLKAADARGADWFGAALALADDGATLAVGAIGEDSAGIGAGSGPIDDCAAGENANNCMTDSGAVYVFARAGGVWSQQAYLKASNPGSGDGFGGKVALSALGTVLAASATGEDSAATLVGGNQVDDCDSATPANCAVNSGAVYLFRRQNGAWSQERYVKASNTGASDGFGRALALSGDGSILAVGAPFEDSFVSGVNVTPATNRQNSSRDSGAVYVYRDGAFLSFVKSSHGERSDTDDNFGSAVALSADGSRLAVGTIGNDCPFTGQPGLPVYSGLTPDPENMQPSQTVCGTPQNSGAVYLY